jgi:hypothetical protein
MRTALQRHGARVAVATLALAAALGGTTTADATPRDGHDGGRAPHPVEVAIGDSGIQAPHVARPVWSPSASPPTTRTATTSRPSTRATGSRSRRSSPT